MAKKQTIIKKPNGNGNISITIENNLKNTNIAPPVVKKKRRRKKAPTEEVNLPPPKLLPPLKDVSYIKPPSDRFTVWRDNLDDSFNTTIPLGQAQQMGLLRSLATPALTNQPPPQRTELPPIMRASRAIYDPLDISSDDELSAPSLSAPSVSSLSAPSVSSLSAPSTSSYVTAQRAPSISSSSAPSLPSSVSSNFMREMNQLMTGLGRGNAYDDNLQYDPYGNEQIQERFSDRSSLASFDTAQEEPIDQERSPTPPLPDPARERSPTPPLPDRERSLTPPLPGREQAEKPFAVDIYEELAEERPGISIDEAGKMLAADKDATPQDVQEFKTGKQSILITAKGQGTKHGKAGKDMQAPYLQFQEYVDSYLVGRGEYDAKNFLTMDQDLLFIDPDGLYRNSFAKIKNSVNRGTEKRQTRAKARAKTRNEDN